MSAIWAQQFPFAQAVGLMCGLSSGIVEVDVDSTDENVLADALNSHGNSPIVIRTASDKFKVWYRHNGETRRIRPFPGLPIDVLGAGGFTIAPPSFNASLSAQYQFIAGGLDDLDRLPVMRNAPAPKPASAPSEKTRDVASPLRGMIEGDGRNDALFHAIGPAAWEIYAKGGTRDQLFDVAISHNQESAQPMTVEEVHKVVASVWKMTTQHRNWIGRSGERRTELAGFSANVDAWYLLEFLRVSEGASTTFWIANGLAERFGWTRKRLANAREHLIELGYIVRVKPAWSKSPASYTWA